MIQPIDTAPKTRAIMVIEKGGLHVEVRWQSYSQQGETLWEGWCYEDVILADVAPEGPEDPTHWYDKPSIDHPAKASLPSPASHDEWREWCSRNFTLAQADYLKFPGTPVQAVTLARIAKNNDLSIIDLQLRQITEVADPIPLTPTATIASDDVFMTSQSHWCPVIRDRSTGAQFLVDTHGGVHSVRKS